MRRSLGLASSSTSGTSPSTAIPTSSTCMSATSGPRSIDRSDGGRSRPSAASAIDCGATRPMAVPLRLRLTIIFTAGMAVVLVVVGAFLYTRLAADLLGSVDLGLRAKAQVLLDATDAGQLSSELLAEGSLVDADESFAQLLDHDGRIVASSPAVARAPIITASSPGGFDTPIFSTVDMPAFDDAVRIMAVRTGETGTAGTLVVGATLGDREDALARVRELLALIGPSILFATAVAGWLVAGAALRPVD